MSGRMGSGGCDAVQKGDLGPVWGDRVMHGEEHPPSPVDRMTDGQTRLEIFPWPLRWWAVKIHSLLSICGKN